MKHVPILLILLSLGCTNSKTTSEQSVTDTAHSSPAVIVKSHNVPTTPALTDTTSHGTTVRFIELTEKEFDSLKSHVVRSEIPLSPFSNEVKRADSCQVFRLDNGKKDSLCNKDDGEYYEKYEIKGRWREKNLLLVNFMNWEEVHDYFVDLRDGSIFILSPFYEVNPGRDIIVSYIDITSAPIYPSELAVTKFEKEGMNVLFLKDLGQTTITDALWISNSECLLATGWIDDEMEEPTDKRKYLMKIE